MYCPLCKAEYRDGFDRCSDCKLKLVPTREEAQTTRVVKLCEGARLSEFNAVVGALDDANIANQAETGGSMNFASSWRSYAGVFLIFRLMTWIAGRNQSVSWKIFVLESDYVAAQAIAERILS
jgi:hypothetical protein